MKLSFLAALAANEKGNGEVHYYVIHVPLWISIPVLVCMVLLIWYLQKRQKQNQRYSKKHKD